jgi:RNA polymerase sigma-70 factor (ECF subfamily)
MENYQLFEELFSFNKTVFRICLGFTKNPGDARDLVQEVYIKAYKKLKYLKNQEKKKEWLFIITRNTCIDYVRKKRFRYVSLDRCYNLKNEDDPAVNEELRQQIAKVKACIQQLPKKQRDVFILKEYADLSYKEITRVLNIKMGTVMSRLNRAKVFLIKKVRSSMDE